MKTCPNPCSMVIMCCDTSNIPGHIFSFIHTHKKQPSQCIWKRNRSVELFPNATSLNQASKTIVLSHYHIHLRCSIVVKGNINISNDPQSLSCSRWYLLSGFAYTLQSCKDLNHWAMMDAFPCKCDNMSPNCSVVWAFSCDLAGQMVLRKCFVVWWPWATLNFVDLNSL